MKKVVRCKKCSHRAIFSGCGFVKQRQLMCTIFHRDITLDDGCTFGEEGDPSHKVVTNVDIFLNGHEAVKGYYYE